MTEPPRYQPTDSSVSPRFTGVRTYARCPLSQDWAGADAAILGVPFDTATSFRPGARYGPAAIREMSLMMRRWHPVLELYIKYCAARLEGIGGDPSAVPASLDWHPELPHRDEHAACGKVVEVLFDCHGEFEGFVLDECCRRRRVTCRERAIGELALRAARENLTLRVRFCAESDRIDSLAVVAA